MELAASAGCGLAALHFAVVDSRNIRFEYPVPYILVV